MVDRKNDSPPMKMRIGINTGHVVVGTLGNDLRVEFKAVGETVNLASRMEAIAEPGTTYVTEATFKHAEGFFRFESLGPKNAKGIKAPIKVYRVIAVSSLRTRFDVSAERGLTPLLGREREIDILLDAFERAKARRGQAVSIVSEAGLGKSRLLYEFRKLIANEKITFLEGQCTSFTQGIAYYPIKDILKANFDIQVGDDDVTVIGKVKKGLKLLDADEKDTLPYLLELLAVQDSGVEQNTLSPDGLRAQAMEALTKIVLKGSELRPLVMAFEDLHWMDKSSEETLGFLLECIPGSRVLLLFPFRPEFKQPWETRSYHSQLMLDRLSMLECIKMATQLVGTDSLDDPLERFIHAKTDGVPFFIEEFIRSLQNLGILDVREGICSIAKDIDNTSVPATIQDIIMSRVDRLPDRAKNLLQTGSAIEREFSLKMIKSVTGLAADDIISNLTHAKNAELIYERGVYPQTTYIFKHALTRDVIYSSILEKKKVILHSEIANAIEIINAANLEDVYGILAEHYFLSEKIDEALRYSKFAAINAQKTASLNDAIYFTKKSLLALETLPSSEEIDLKIIDARTILAIYQVTLNYFVKAKEIVEPIIQIAEKYNYKKRLAQIYIVVGTYESFVNENHDKGSLLLNQGIKISEELSDFISIILGNHWIGWNLCFTCQFEKAYEHFGKALEINEMFSNNWGVAAVKACFGVVYYWNGKIGIAYDTCSEAIELADKSGDIFSKALSYANYGIASYGKRFTKRALTYLKKGSGYCSMIKYHLWDAICNFNLAEIYFDLENFDKSKSHYEKAVELLENEKYNPSFINLCKLGIDKVAAKKGNSDVDLDLLTKYSEGNRTKLFEGWISRYICEILLNHDDKYLNEANNLIERAIKNDIGNNMMLLLGKDYTIYAEVLKRQGYKNKSSEILNKAIATFKECGADGWV